jgi:formate hydrogenlyase transcriptional activator
VNKSSLFASQAVMKAEPSKSDGAAFSTEPLLNILELIFAGAPLQDVLASIAQLIESQVEGMLCTIWLPDEDGKHLRCAAAPGIPNFRDQVGVMAIGPKGGSCGTAIYRKQPVFVQEATGPSALIQVIAANPGTVTNLVTISTFTNFVKTRRNDLALPVGVKN